jgi:N-acetylneuraminate synthase
MNRMDQEFKFRDLFVYDLANNHQGDVAHGKAIIREMGRLSQAHTVRGMMKFQFRQLESFIHPSHRESSDNKHVPRFLSTRLTNDQFRELYDTVREAGLLAACTPFDEESVDVITDMGFDVLKVASCSARDWPLLEKIAEANLPVIFSTGGLTFTDIDRLVSFFQHRGVSFAIMHCVSIYPTKAEMCELNQIDALCKRYPGVVIGWSTHEDPADSDPVLVAYAKGARMFERHVGIATDTIKLNAYSSTPAQIDTWLTTHAKARALCGSDERPPVPAEEAEAMDSLRRGVYAQRPIAKGTRLTKDDVYFAMPYVEGQLPSGRWREGEIVLNATVAADGPVMAHELILPEPSKHQLIKDVIHEVKALLNEASVPLNSSFEVEFSHHYGMEHFHEFGAVIIGCINRSYCKKIIVQLPGQKHPPHFHKRKEETFQVLSGVLRTNVDGYPRTLHPGETMLIQPGVWHSFWSDTGCVFEEVSTTHYDDDSFYRDKRISRMPRAARKTVVDHWGRFQVGDDANSIAMEAPALVEVEVADGPPTPTVAASGRART